MHSDQAKVSHIYFVINASLSQFPSLLSAYLNFEGGYSTCNAISLKFDEYSTLWFSEVLILPHTGLKVYRVRSFITHSSLVPRPHPSKGRVW